MTKLCFPPFSFHTPQPTPHFSERKKGTLLKYAIDKQWYCNDDTSLFFARVFKKKKKKKKKITAALARNEAKKKLIPLSVSFLLSYPEV